MTLLVAELALEAGGEGALGGQVILQAQDVVLQAQDAQGRSQDVALVEQFPDPAGEGQLAAGVAAVPASRPLRRDRPRGIQGAQEGLLHPQRRGGPPGGVSRVVRVIQPVRPHGCPLQGPRAAARSCEALDSFLQSAL